jgi:hypothetical protein
LITGGKSHDANVGCKGGDVIFLQEGHDLIVDDCCVGIVNGAVPDDGELWCPGSGNLVVEDLSRFDVRANDVGDSLGGIETCDLDNVLAEGVEEFGHSPFIAHGAEHLHVVLLIVRPHRFAETIKPVIRDT